MRRCLLALCLLTAPPARASAQEPGVPPGPVTLLQAITLGRTRGVEGAIARLDLRRAEARVGQRRADLLPTIEGNAAVTRQTLNLDEFGIPIATGVTDPFEIYRLQLRASQ